MDDQERPCLRIAPCSPKQPFVLCHKPMIQVPATINQYLRDYQREGVAFLYNLYSRGQGGILADDMGLGKTIQVIALLAALLHKHGNHRDVSRAQPRFIRQLSDEDQLNHPHQTFLIIAPGSVMYNWMEELDTWGHFVVRKYHGSDKTQTLCDIQKDKVEVVITTFDTYRLNEAVLSRVEWQAVFVDEVHKIKGLNAATTTVLNALTTPLRYGLTGTLLQNNMAELWTLLNWARPGCLGNLANFTVEYSDVIERGQRHSATKRELATARHKMLELKKVRSEFVLRRTKAIISDQLPNKEDNVVMCPLSPLQLDVYSAILAHPDVRDGVLRMEEPCGCGRRKMRSRCCYKLYSLDPEVKWSQVMMSFMHVLLKAANHAALLIPDRNTAEMQEKRAREVCDIAFSNHPQFVTSSREAAFRTLSHPQYCGKMKILHGLLGVFFKRKAKVLLFSYSTRMLDILEQYILSVGHDYRRLDGSTKNKTRQDIVKEFNADPHLFICLVSTKAGGLGLNLTGANVVILFDPNWNPSNDLQAQDRAYRIGQRRDVKVYRLISSGTIEENMYLRQIYKQQLDNVSVLSENAKRLFDAMSGDKNARGELFGVKNMFQLRTGDTCLTHDILQRNENLEAGLTGYAISTYIPSVSPTDQSTDYSIGESLDTNDNDGSDNEENDGIALNSLSLSDDGGVGDDDDYHDNDRDIHDNQSTSAITKTNSSNVPDSVSDVFDECGVKHIHDNRRAVGSSKAENYMTLCAMEDVFDSNRNSQLPAVQCPPSKELAETRVKGKRGVTKRDPTTDHNSVCMRQVGSHTVLIGQTPVAVRRHQFNQLTTSVSLNSPSRLASKIVAMTPQERINLLNNFYEDMNPELGHVLTGPTQRDTENDPKTAAVKPKSCSRKRQSKAIFLSADLSESDTLPEMGDIGDTDGVAGHMTDRVMDDMAEIVMDREDDMEVGRQCTPRKVGHGVCRESKYSPSKCGKGMSVGRGKGAKGKGLAVKDKCKTPIDDNDIGYVDAAVSRDVKKSRRNISTLMSCDVTGSESKVFADVSNDTSRMLCMKTDIHQEPTTSSKEDNSRNVDIDTNDVPNLLETTKNLSDSLKVDTLLDEMGVTSGNEYYTRFSDTKSDAHIFSMLDDIFGDGPTGAVRKPASRTREHLGTISSNRSQTACHMKLDCNGESETSSTRNECKRSPTNISDSDIPFTNNCTDVNNTKGMTDITRFTKVRDNSKDSRNDSSHQIPHSSVCTINHIVNTSNIHTSYDRPTDRATDRTSDSHGDKCDIVSGDLFTDSTHSTLGRNNISDVHCIDVVETCGADNDYGTSGTFTVHDICGTDIDFNSKRKRRRRKPKPGEVVDTLIRDGHKEFNELFESGHLTRRSVTRDRCDRSTSCRTSEDLFTATCPVSDTAASDSLFS